MSDAKSLPRLTLVLGGARSGKSRLAEGLIAATGRPRHYIATAEAHDDEMRARIARHQTDRGPNWQTWSAPRAVAEVLAAIPADAAVLVDCATLWLSNHLLAGSDIAKATADLIAALHACPSPVVVV